MYRYGQISEWQASSAQYSNNQLGSLYIYVGPSILLNNKIQITKKNMETSMQNQQQECLSRFESEVKQLRSLKTKKYSHQCEKHHSKIRKSTTIVHNTVLFWMGPNGEVKTTFYQKTRDRKSKENIIKWDKMRNQAREFNNKIINDV